MTQSNLQILPWKPVHTPWLRQALYNYLSISYDNGGLIIPSDINADRLLSLGLTLAKRYDPTLILLHPEAGPIAFTLWGRTPSRLSTRPYCEAIGTYVDPAHRTQGHSKTLRKAALERAKARGYELVIGTAYTETNSRITRDLGFKIRGTLLYYHL